MAKRNKNETPEPILIACRTQFTREEREQGKNPTWDVLPDNVYKGLQPTLTNDYLHLEIDARSYFIPARILLDLARIWKDEPYFIQIELDLSNAILYIKSGQTQAGKFTSRTEIKCICEAGDAEVEYACRLYSAVPFAFDDGSPWAEKLRAPAAPVCDAWLWKAASKDEARPALCYPWGDFATDGIRVHIDRRIPRRDFSDLDEYTRPSESDLQYYGQGLERESQKAQDNPSLVTVDAKDFARAVKLAGKINKAGIFLSANGRLDVTAVSEYEAEGGLGLTEENGYTKSGPDALVHINPRYLLDALSGFEKGEILLSLPQYHESEEPGPTRAKAALYLTDGTREAIIFPLVLG